MNDTLKAAIWMIGAITSFTLMAVAGRTVSVELDTFEIMLYRSLTGVIVVFAVGYWAGTLGQLRRQRISHHFARNISHFTGQNLWFFAITAIPLAQAFALEFTTPVWVILLAPLILGEKITRFGLLSATLGFVGILIVARPTPETISPGLIAAAASAVFFALTAIFTRRLTRDQSITEIMFYMTVMQTVFGLVCAGIDGNITVPTAAGAYWVILIGFAGLVAHFCLTTALSLAPASIVMPIDFVRLPVITVVGALLYSEGVDALVFLGAVFIFGANYLNITRAQQG